MAVATGTAALHLALLVAGVERGDEVWVSDLTFIASANAADECGARITLVDSEADSWNLDPDVVVDELDRRAAAGRRSPRRSCRSTCSGTRRTSRRSWTRRSGTA